MINKRPTTANEIDRDMEQPNTGGLTATEFKKKYGMSKKTAKLIRPKTATRLKRGGYVKAGASYKG